MRGRACARGLLAEACHLVGRWVKDTGRGAVLSRLGYDGLTRPKSYHLRREF